MKCKIVTILLITTLLCGILPLINTLTTVKASPTIRYVPVPYATISAAIAAANPGDTIIVAAGTYSETLQISESLTISAVGHVIVQGCAMFATHYSSRQAVIFVTGASNVVLNGLDVEGVGLGGGGIKSYAILYESSTGIVQNCTISPNTATAEDMSSTAIAAWDNSVLTVEGCTVENFGRIGVYTNNATITINGNTIVGQPYTDPSLVSYGIEIEDYTGASMATITNNNIYNCGNSNPGVTWASDAIIVDIWRYYDAGSLQPSTVQIESNNIHNNFEAIELVSNSMSYAHYNNIANNLLGVWVDTDEHGNYGSFDARFNWWGNPSGPLAYVDYDSVNVIVSGFLTAPFTAQLYTSPMPVVKTYGDIGTNFNLDVKVQNIQDFFGFDINMTWNNTLITFVSCSYTATLNAMWPSWYLEQETTGVNAGTGWYRLVAVSTSSGFTTTGSQTVFTLTFHIATGSNLQQLQTPIHFAAVKLSNSLYASIPAQDVDGLYEISAATPDLEFQLINPNPSKPFEYGKYVEVQVNVTDISSALTGFDITVDYSSEFLMAFARVQWGVLGNGTVDNGTAGIVEVSLSGGTPYTGSNTMLFTLLFQVQFDDRSSHIWTTATAPNTVSATISLDTTTGSLTFADGNLLVGSVTAPSPVNLTIHLIQGDVTCDGHVNVLDLSTVANFYDQTSPLSPSAAKYDVKTDGTIDLFDLVVVASNFGYYKPDTAPF